MFSHSVAQVSSVVMLHAETPLPVGSIAKLAGLAYTSAASALQTLTNRGLIERSQRAGQDEFSPDKASPYYPMAYAAALVDLPVAEALRGLRVFAVFAYGSLAHPGGGSKHSDLDLFIVGDIKDKSAVVARLLPVGERIGRAVDPFIVTPEQYEGAIAVGDPHVLSAAAGVRLFGAV